jgi:hypothetical protein
VLTERATALLSGTNGLLNPKLEPVLSAMLAVDRPKSTLFWLQQSESAKILRAMALGELAISHQDLDVLPRTRALDYLRDLLIITGVLPDEPVHVERISQWLQDFLTNLPAAQAQLIRQFATWSVLRRLRAAAARQPTQSTQSPTARENIRAAAALLAWLAQHGLQLADLRQAVLDQWMTEQSPSRRERSHAFLAWARSRRLISELRIDRRPATVPGQALHHDQRWALVTNLLHNIHIPLDHRVAGLFLLLFGQQVSRIARMTTQQVQITKSAVCVTFGRDPVVMPAPLDELIRQLPHTRGQSLYHPGEHHWLFPGAYPGRPISAQTLRAKLHALGMTSATAARNASLMQLAAEMPAPVLSDLLNISPSRAVAWTKLTKKDWAAYTAHRAASG